MKKIILGIIIITFYACQPAIKQSINQVETNEITKSTDSDKIRVLNFGTIHFTQSTDAISTTLNLEDPKEQADLKRMVEKIVEFKPTVILLELEPKYNEYLMETYEKYKVDQTIRLNFSDELNAIGLEVGRLSKTKRVYGIDSRMGFDYPSLIELANRKVKDSLFVHTIRAYYKKRSTLKLEELFLELNTTESKMRTFDYYNFLATQHTENKYEGAKIISEFYERNLRMYSNINDISLSKKDKVFILTGATHTAYLDVFLSNSNKFILENPAIYTEFAE